MKRWLEYFEKDSHTRQTSYQKFYLYFDYWRVTLYSLHFQFLLPFVYSVLKNITWEEDKLWDKLRTVSGYVKENYDRPKIYQHQCMIDTKEKHSFILSLTNRGNIH